MIVDDASQGAVTSYTFANVISGHSISVSFKGAGPVIDFGVFGAEGVKISGGGSVDSYDSSKGPYNGEHGPNGSVGTNSIFKGAITLTGMAKIYGDVLVGSGGDPSKVITTNGGAAVYGVKDALISVRDMTPLSDPGGGAATSFTKGTVLTSGTYRVSAVRLSGNGAAKIDGHVTLFVNGNFSVSGDSEIAIAPAASLTLYVSGNISISGRGIVNKSFNPHALKIYGTSICTSASYSGNGNLYGIMYAPNANIIISGNSSIYGSVIGKSVMMSGNATVHYDESLGY